MDKDPTVPQPPDELTAQGNPLVSQASDVLVPEANVDIEGNALVAPTISEAPRVSNRRNTAGRRY